MEITVTVKDENVQMLGTEFGDPINPVQAITAYLQAIADAPLPRLIKENDPEILAMTAARDQKIQEKIASAKAQGK